MLSPARCGACLLGLVLVAPGPLTAQTAEEDSVRGRARPEFVPLGIELDDALGAMRLLDAKTVKDKSSPMASFVVFPKLELAGSYESNLFRDTSRQADRIAVVSPGLAVRSDWNNHAFELALNSDIGRHDRNPSEDYEDVRGAANAMVDVAENLQVRGQVELARLHLKRGTLFGLGRTGAAVEYEQATAGLGAQYTGDRIQIRPQFKVVSQDYKTSAGRNNDDLDRVIAEVSGRLSYEVLPGTAVFVEPSYNRRDYDLDRDSAGLLQDSHGTQLLAGFTWDVSGVTFLEFGTGYLRQEFDEPRFGTVQGPALSGRLLWNPRDSLTLDVRIARSVEEKKSVNTSGLLVTSVKSRIDYELFYDVILSLLFDYANEEDKRTKVTDHRYNAAAEARYLLGPNWYTGLLVGYDKLNSQDDDVGYSNTRVTLRLGAQI